MAKKMCFWAELLMVRMRNQVVHETKTVMRLVVIVRRRAWRREGLRSIQRPRAPEKKRTQMVSAIPLRFKVRQGPQYRRENLLT